MNDSNTLRHIILSGPLFLRFLEYVNRGKAWRFIYQIINPILCWLILLMFSAKGASWIGGVQSQPYDVLPSITGYGRFWAFFGFFILLNIVILIEKVLEYSNFFLFKLLSAIVFTPWIILITSPLLYLVVNVFPGMVGAACLTLFWIMIFIWYMFFYNRTNKH